MKPKLEVENCDGVEIVGINDIQINKNKHVDVDLNGKINSSERLSICGYQLFVDASEIVMNTIRSRYKYNVKVHKCDYCSFYDKYENCEECDGYNYFIEKYL